jgi:hypothetical protein
VHSAAATDLAQVVLHGLVALVAYPVVLPLAVVAAVVAVAVAVAVVAVAVVVVEDAVCEDDVAAGFRGGAVPSEDDAVVRDALEGDVADGAEVVVAGIGIQPPMGQDGDHLVALPPEEALASAYPGIAVAWQSWEPQVRVSFPQTAVDATDVETVHSSIHLTQMQNTRDPRKRLRDGGSRIQKAVCNIPRCSVKIHHLPPYRYSESEKIACSTGVRNKTLARTLVTTIINQSCWLDAGTK